MHSAIFDIINNIQFFAGLQIFFHAGIDFFLFCKISTPCKNDVCGYWFLQDLSRILHDWYFLEIFVQIPKNNFSWSRIKYILAACKK